MATMRSPRSRAPRGALLFVAVVTTLGGCGPDGLTTPSAVVPATADPRESASSATFQITRVTALTTPRASGGDTTRVVRTVHEAVVASRTSQAHNSPSTSGSGQLWSNGSALAVTSGSEAQPKDLVAEVMSVPAPLAATICRAGRPWADTLAYDNAGGAVLYRTGTGQGPATTLRLVRNGREALRVQRTWVRRAAAWQLVSSVSDVPNGRYRESVTIRERRDGHLLAVTGVPTAACTSPDRVTSARRQSVTSRTPTVANASPVAGIVPSAAPASGLSFTSGPADLTCQQALEAPGWRNSFCDDKRYAVQDAQDAFYLAGVEAAIGCLLPGVDIITCPAGGINFASKVAALRRAEQRALACEVAIDLKAVKCASCGISASAKQPNPFAITVTERKQPLGGANLACEDVSEGEVQVPGYGPGSITEFFGLSSPMYSDAGASGFIMIERCVTYFSFTNGSLSHVETVCTPRLAMS